MKRIKRVKKRELWLKVCSTLRNQNKERKKTDLLLLADNLLWIIGTFTGFQGDQCIAHKVKLNPSFTLHHQEIRRASMK